MVSIGDMLSKAKDRKIAALLACAGIFLPGLHKFYLGQPKWGVIYLLLSWTPIPRIASIVEAIWYLFQDRDQFDSRFNPPSLNPTSGQALSKQGPFAPAQVELQVERVASALRQIEQLRQEGLISEYEFEQKRRQLLDRIR
ncbi:NINE protein [Leptolyngbya sp. 7M]|uniref:NINE protein n=1 Tax=Leptolyngbya sp. 7M TaxID=2812896 RepID=UPI0021F18D44|nr:NINE protein [Leptolyngbya sp. 7M]